MTTALDVAADRAIGVARNVFWVESGKSRAVSFADTAKDARLAHSIAPVHSHFIVSAPECAPPIDMHIAAGDPQEEKATSAWMRLALIGGEESL